MSIFALQFTQLGGPNFERKFFIWCEKGGTLQADAAEKPGMRPSPTLIEATVKEGKGPWEPRARINVGVDGSVFGSVCGGLACLGGDWHGSGVQVKMELDPIGQMLP